MTNEEKRSLIDRALSAQRHAYAPYSRFSVGAALLCKDGTVYEGVNIENASYSATICAERTALFAAIAEGKREFRAIAIVGGERGEPCFPCGVCRQVLAEFCKEDFSILLADGGEVIEKTLGSLLPSSFRLK